MKVKNIHFTTPTPDSPLTLPPHKATRGWSPLRQTLAILLCLGALCTAQAQTWSTATVPAGVPADPNHAFYTVAHNGTKFVASGGELSVVSSTDGVNWTYDGQMSNATLASVFDLAWIPYLNKWVAATNVNMLTNSVIYTSANGTTWTPTNSGIASGIVNNFATDGTKIIGTANNAGRLVKSTDASTWTVQTLTGVTTAALFSIIHVPSTSNWVAVGGSGTIITSSDGNTWKKQTSPVSTSFRAVAYGNGRYVAVSNGAGIAAWSTDAVTWTQASTGLVSQGLARMIFVNGIFLAVGTNGAIVSSTDGATWSVPHTANAAGENISDVAASGTGGTAKLVAVGGSTTPIIRHINASAASAVSALSPSQPLTFSLFPNPATEEAWLDLSVAEGLPCLVRLMDPRGVLVQQHHVAQATPGLFRLDLEGLPKGLYVVQVQALGKGGSMLKLTLAQ